MRNRIDVLNLEWTGSPSRDRTMATLVCVYLRKLGYRVIEGPVFDGYHYIRKYRPKILLMTNTVGAGINLDLMKYAKSKGIYGVSLISEGNFKGNDDLIDQFVWGVNEEKVLYEDLHMQWSERTRKMTVKLFPDLENRVKVSGGVGFDVYQLSEFMKKEDFLKKYRKTDYRKVIGFGCWDFGAFWEKDHRYPINLKVYGKENISRFESDGKKLNGILKELIGAYPDILFLLKEHPGNISGYEASAIDGCETFENVVIIKNEENIQDCIAVSDFWLVYESTTAMEAWLMGKQTALINPSGVDFPRDEVYRGSPNYHDAESLKIAVNQFYSNQTLPDFHKHEKQRKEIIRSVIQWPDGLNHVRAGNEIASILEANEFQNYQDNDSSRRKLHLLKLHGYWVMAYWLGLIPRFKGLAEKKKKFPEKKLIQYQNKMKNESESFYKKHHLNIDQLKKIRAL